MSGYMKKKHSKLVASKRESSGSDSDSSDYGSKRAEEVHQIPNVEDEHQRPNIGNFFDEDDQPFVPINVAAPNPGDDLRPIEQSIIMRRAARVREPFPVTGQKRKQAVEEERGKCKNCRNHPRAQIKQRCLVSVWDIT